MVKLRKVEYSTIKCKLKSALRFFDMLPIIQDLTTMTNKVWAETMILFELHIYKMLKQKKRIDFDYDTIDKCRLFVLNQSDAIRNKNKVYDELKDTYDKYYLPIGNNKLTDYFNVTTLSYPFNYLTKQYITDVENHCSLNFFRFQKKYIRSLVLDAFAKFGFKRGLLWNIVGCIQYNLNNNNNDVIEIRSKKILKLANIDEIAEIMKNIIIQERLNMPEQVRLHVSKKRLRENYEYVLKYYYHMVMYLEGKDLKRFSILPQISLGYSYIKFDSRFASIVYNQWCKLILDNGREKEFDFEIKRVNIKDFEANYKYYYEKCFNFKRINKARNANPISFMTNGYSIVIVYEQKQKKIWVIGDDEFDSLFEIHEDDDKKDNKTKTKTKKMPDSIPLKTYWRTPICRTAYEKSKIFHNPNQKSIYHDILRACHIQKE